MVDPASDSEHEDLVADVIPQGINPTGSNPMPEREPIDNDALVEALGSQISEKPIIEQNKKTIITDGSLSESSGSGSYYTSNVNHTGTSKMHTTSGDNTSSPFIQEHTPMESAA